MQVGEIAQADRSRGGRGSGQAHGTPSGAGNASSSAEGTFAGGADEFDPGPRVLNYIGFQQMAGVSRIFARFDGKPRYRAERESDGRMFVELYSTHVNVKNNTRPLDTTYFDSPVTRIQAVPNEKSTRIEIRVREAVDWRIKWIGTTLAIDVVRAEVQAE